MKKVTRVYIEVARQRDNGTTYPYILSVVEFDDTWSKKKRDKHVKDHYTKGITDPTLKIREEVREAY